MAATPMALPGWVAAYVFYGYPNNPLKGLLNTGQVSVQISSHTTSRWYPHRLA